MLNVLFAVYQFHFHTELLVQVFGHVLGRINRTVLATGTSKANHEVAESTFHVSFYGSIDQCIGIFEEWEDFTIVFQELDDRLIQSGKWFVAFVLSRVVYRTAIEYKATTIAGRVVRNAFLVGKAHDLDGKLALLQIVLELLHLCEFAENGAEVRIFRVIFSQQLAEIFDGKWNALDKVWFLFEVTTETICTQYLQSTELYEVTQLAEEMDAVDGLVLRYRFFPLASQSQISGKPPR